MSCFCGTEILGPVCANSGISESGIRAIDCIFRMHFDQTTKKLYVDRTKEVGVVYFLGASDDEDFKCEEDWEMRLNIERSTAVKIPFIGTLLADRKKIQQVSTF